MKTFFAFALTVIIGMYCLTIYKNMMNEGPQNATINIKVRNPSLWQKPEQETFFDVKQTDLMILQITRTTGNICSRGQALMYAKIGTTLYVALPKHCMPDDATESIELTMVNGNKIDFDSYATYALGHMDAAILVLFNTSSAPVTTYSNKKLTATFGYGGDTVVLNTPFNIKKRRKKIGTNIELGSVKYSPYNSEKGDSGGLVIGRTGVMGIHVSNSRNGTSQYIPMTYFEEIYQYAKKDVATMQKKISASRDEENRIRERAMYGEKTSL